MPSRVLPPVTVTETAIAVLRRFALVLDFDFDFRRFFGRDRGRSIRREFGSVDAGRRSVRARGRLRFRLRSAPLTEASAELTVDSSSHLAPSGRKTLPGRRRLRSRFRRGRGRFPAEPRRVDDVAGEQLLHLLGDRRGRLLRADVAERGAHFSAISPSRRPAVRRRFRARSVRGPSRRGAEPFDPAQVAVDRAAVGVDLATNSVTESSPGSSSLPKKPLLVCSVSSTIWLTLRE